MAGGVAGKFILINAWRNISSQPISNDHLAVLDESSTVKPDDYLVSEFWERSYSLLQYKLSAVHSARHRWYYFPAMTRDEVLLFKQVSFAVCL